MKRVIIALALLTLTGCPTVDWDVPQVGDPCTCQAGEGMVITEIAAVEDENYVLYCAKEVGNPTLAMCFLDR